MATVQTQVWTAAQAFTISLNSLGNNTYVGSSGVDWTSYLDVVVELVTNPGAATGRMRLFLRCSMDGTNFSTGPTSGTTTTDEPQLFPLGSMPITTASTSVRKQFPVLAALGFVPLEAELVVLNNAGAALAGSGNSANWYGLTGANT